MPANSPATGPQPRTALCVFCGSAAGIRPVYAEAAREVGRLLATRGLGLVYGGGSVGLMGLTADAALAAGGHVVGVIPQALDRREIAHTGLHELIITPDMHERKAVMAARSAGFLTLPGGIGTFEEFFEILSWAALGLHQKPLGLLDVDGYYAPLMDLLGHAVAEGFLRPADRALVLVDTDPARLIDGLMAYQPPPPGPRWIDVNQA
jgi:uncharacterized protein (TIGR00730 family)